MLPCGFSDTPTSANSWSMVNTICQGCWKVVYSIAFSWKKTVTAALDHSKKPQPTKCVTWQSFYWHFSPLTSLLNPLFFWTFLSSFPVFLIHIFRAAISSDLALSFCIFVWHPFLLTCLSRSCFVLTLISFNWHLFLPSLLFDHKSCLQVCVCVCLFTSPSLDTIWSFSKPWDPKSSKSLDQIRPN